MEIQSIFFKGKWRKLNDTIIFFPLLKWKVVEFLDSKTALVERKGKYKVIKGEVRIS
jgi:hypothetical protein